MEAIISAGLGLLAKLVPSLTTAASVSSAIKFLGTVLVPGVQLVKDEIPIVKAIIASLRGNKSVTAKQMAELDALDARCDAILDAAIEAAERDDAASAPAKA